MKNKAGLALGIVVSLVAVCAIAISQYAGGFTLEEPGLKLADFELYDEHGKLAATNSVFLPMTMPGYTSEVQPVTVQELEWLPPDTTYGRRVYSGIDGFTSSISIVLMGTDRTSIHKPEYCLYGQGFVIDTREEINVRIQRPHEYDLPVMKLMTTRKFKDVEGNESNVRGIYLYWFVSRDLITASHNERMWWMAEGLMKSGSLQRWAYVTYFSLCLPGEEEALLERMKHFIASSVPEFQLTTLADDS